jgi:hypothetical protein
MYDEYLAEEREEEEREEEERKDKEDWCREGASCNCCGGICSEGSFPLAM